MKALPGAIPKRFTEPKVTIILEYKNRENLMKAYTMITQGASYSCLECASLELAKKKRLVIEILPEYIAENKSSYVKLMKDIAKLVSMELDIQRKAPD